ncbi:MAG: tRNA (adenosine(37)-N6)-dimethylallyltransferase MiaA [Parcubacteria group bacterium RIFCSPHIGHO2_02_FULL_48_10b]|nr:MAG: tRNA (adenosine(37)-N6)-dimethylallyltransferase MiaA [Parcubacteria group bacterium RIFCSPHIGHO2_02_FULL_48_10b]
MGKYNAKPKLLVILGPTASGKSELAVELARKLNGEIVSADSRQVYRGMDVGTGKVPKDKMRDMKSGPSINSGSSRAKSRDEIRNKFQNSKISAEGESASGGKNRKLYLYRGVRHHLIDVADPKKTFTVVDYVRLAQKAIDEIARRGRLPIICGGTGLYIDALLYGITFPAAKANKKLRQLLEKQSAERLFKELKTKDPRRADTIDPYNKRRLIRALEIIAATNAPTPSSLTTIHCSMIVGDGENPQRRTNRPYLKIGVKKSRDELRALITQRLKKRLEGGLVDEVRRLHEQRRLSWKKLESFGFEYRYVSWYLQNKLPAHCYPSETASDADALVSCLDQKNWQYAKRQMTWFKRDKEIHWTENYKEAERLTRRFITSPPELIF